MGVKMAFLPPYSPDMNPIEEWFSVLKKWMKKNSHLADDLTDFEEFFLLAVEANRGGDHAQGHFRHAGYLFEEH